MDNYIQEAFNRVCKKARKPHRWYVVLFERVSFYGGPEEGGWWGSDSIVRGYQQFPSRKLANEAKEAVDKFAYSLTQQAKREDGAYCLRSMEWLEERGLEADFLPEPDGPSEYYVQITKRIPENVYGVRGYS